MKNLLSVARFEWQYHWHRPATYLFASLIFGQGCWQAITVAQRYPGSSADVSMYFALSSLGVVSALVLVLLAGQSLTKDREFRAAAYLYTLPVTSRSYMAGRFLGTLLLALGLSVFQPFGALTALFYQNPAAPLPVLVLIDGFVRLTLENTFIVTSLVFSLTVLLHGIRGAYLSLFLVLLYFMLTEVQSASLADSDLWQLLDPFGVSMVRESIEAMSTTGEAGSLLTFSDILLINRLLWLGLSAGLLAQAEAAFSFQETNQPPLTRRRSAPTASNRLVPVSRLSIHQSFGVWSRVSVLIRLTRLDFLTLVRQPFFQVTVGMLILLTVLLATAFGQNGNFPQLPLTASMTALRLPMGVFISLFLLVMTGELLFQERPIGFWPIADALPQPAVIGVGAKLVALSGLALLLTLTLFLTGVAIQVRAGFWDIDWSLYALDLTMDGFLRYCQLIALGAFVAAMVNDRIISHVITLLLFGLLWALYQFGPVGIRPWLYSFLPGSDHYSTLTGYGVNNHIRLVTHLQWWSLAGLLATGAAVFWNRGIPVRLRDRLRVGWQRIGLPYGLAILVFATWFTAGLVYSQRETSQPETTTATPVRRTIQSVSLMSMSGKPIHIRVEYHDNYQVGHILNAAKQALHRGEHLFGPYPQSGLRIIEVPHSSVPVRTAPGSLLLSEKEGWTADSRDPSALDYLDYLIAREVFNQWLTHRMHPIPQAGDGFLRRSLADYLALCIVGEQYGPERLRERLSQRAAVYATSRIRTTGPERTLLQTSNNEGLERGRAALMLSSIGQVWSDTALSRTIGQFYRMAIQQPTSATATQFAVHLHDQLPDSLRYLTTYLSDRLWFTLRIERIANLPNGLSVEVFPEKWRDDNAGHRQQLPLNDLIPLTILDRDGQPVYTALVRPEPDERWIRLPALPHAAAVQIDLLGTWPEAVKHDNRKIF